MMTPQSRAAIPGVTLICSIVAFVIALCCLLAGTNPNTLKDMDLYTLNTSMVSPTLLKDMNLPPPDSSFNVTSIFKRDVTDSLNNAASKVESAGKSAASDTSKTIQSGAANAQQKVDDVKQNVTDSINSAKDTAKKAAGTIVSTFINKTIDSLSIEDFYIAHLLTYCEGSYTTGGNENITYCSNGKPNTLHNVTKGSDDSPLQFIKDLQLPDPVGFGMKAITLISKIIAAFYILGIIATFVTLILSALALFRTLSNPVSGGGTLARLANLAFSAIAFFCLLLASILVHVMVNKICNFFNHHPKLGVAAYPGRNFDRCTWVAVAMTGIVMVGCTLEVAMGISSVSGRFRKSPIGREKDIELEEQSLDERGGVRF